MWVDKMAFFVKRELDAVKEFYMSNKCETCGHEPLITKEQLESIVEQEREYMRNEPYVYSYGEMRIKVVDRPDRMNCVQAQVVVKGADYQPRVTTAWDADPLEAARKAVRHMFQTGGKELTRYMPCEDDIVK